MALFKIDLNVFFFFRFGHGIVITFQAPGKNKAITPLSYHHDPTPKVGDGSWSNSKYVSTLRKTGKTWSAWVANQDNLDSIAQPVQNQVRRAPSFRTPDFPAFFASPDHIDNFVYMLTLSNMAYGCNFQKLTRAPNFSPAYIRYLCPLGLSSYETGPKEL